MTGTVPTEAEITVTVLVLRGIVGPDRPITRAVSPDDDVKLGLILVPQGKGKAANEIIALVEDRLLGDLRSR